MTRPTRLAALALLAGVGFGVVAGCGGSGKKSSTSTTRTVTRTVVEPTSTGATALTTTNGIPGTGNAVTQIGTTNTLGIIRPFAGNSPWNTQIEGLPTDPNSARMMRQARERINVTETTNVKQTGTQVRTLDRGLFINLHRWTVPVVDESNGTATPVFCRQPPLPPPLDLCGDGWTVSSLIVPTGDDPHPEFDGWYTVLNRRLGIAYDLWRARRSVDGGSLSYQFMRIWDLNGPGFLKPNLVSARGSGLPLFAGLVLPEEIQAGRIDHALAISVPAPAQRNYVQPASSTDGNGRITSLPEGARIRLKPEVTLRTIQQRAGDPRCSDQLFGLRDNSRTRRCRRYQFPQRTNKTAASALITALRKYGAIVVDRASVPTLYGKFNADWSTPLRDDNGNLVASDGLPFGRNRQHLSTPLLRGNELQGLRLSDFEVVKLPTLLKFPSLVTTTTSPLPGGATGQSARAPVQAPRRGRGAPRRQTFQPAGGG